MLFRSAGSPHHTAAGYGDGAARSSFGTGTFIDLRDPDNEFGLPVVAAGATYPGSTIAVDPTIRAGRLLTGGDLDIEVMRQDKHGNLWFGEEFGPFLVKTDAAT